MILRARETCRRAWAGIPTIDDHSNGGGGESSRATMLKKRLIAVTIFKTNTQLRKWDMAADINVAKRRWREREAVAAQDGEELLASTFTTTTPPYWKASRKLLAPVPPPTIYSTAACSGLYILVSSWSRPTRFDLIRS